MTRDTFRTGLLSTAFLGVYCIGCSHRIECPRVILVEKGVFATLERELVDLTTQIVVEQNRETYPRQCYFGETHIDFGNYYNHRLLFTHAEFLASRDTLFADLDALERQRLVELSQEMLASGILNAEYSYGFRRYAFLITPSGTYEEQVFMMNAHDLDRVALDHNKMLRVLCRREGYVLYRHRS